MQIRLKDTKKGMVQFHHDRVDFISPDHHDRAFVWLLTGEVFQVNTSYVCLVDLFKEHNLGIYNGTN